MIFWRSGRGFGMVGCGSLLLTSLVIFLLIYALSGGQCGVIVFP
jgi:hypothetical protein